MSLFSPDFVSICTGSLRNASTHLHFICVTPPPPNTHTHTHTNLLLILVGQNLQFSYLMNNAGWPMKRHSIIYNPQLRDNSRTRFVFVEVKEGTLPLMNDNRPVTHKTTPRTLPFTSLQHCKQPRTASCQLLLPAWRVNTLREDFCLRVHHVYCLLNPYISPVSPL
jgi:hypothetical protein